MVSVRGGGAGGAPGSTGDRLLLVFTFTLTVIGAELRLEVAVPEAHVGVLHGLAAWVATAVSGPAG